VGSRFPSSQFRNRCRDKPHGGLHFDLKAVSQWVKRCPAERGQTGVRAPILSETGQFEVYCNIGLCGHSGAPSGLTFWFPAISRQILHNATYRPEVQGSVSAYSCCCGSPRNLARFDNRSCSRTILRGFATWRDQRHPAAQDARRQ
jgi:hypothetical protein